jgi:glycosyltransferase involved in cell wall biosynthesis
MKILHMHFGKEGGAERFFVNLVEGFAERGAEQRFVTRPGRLWLNEVAALGPVMTNHYRRLSLSAPVFAWRVHRMIRAWEPDVIMAWMSRSSRLIPDRPGCVKLTRLGDYPRHLRHFRHNDLIVANTPGIAEKCVRLGWKRPVEVVSNFARQVTAHPIGRADIGTPEDAFVVVGMGRFVGRKGFADLVEAMAGRPDAWLWLIGAGEEEAALRAQVDRLGLAGRTRFFGWLDEPMHVVAAADCLVMPSRHEPLGNVILEAWHVGVPVVTTASEGPSWFASDGVDALITPIGDPASMAGAIGQLQDDPALRRSLVEGGRATLHARFTRDRVLDRYFEIFEGRY